MRLLPKDQDWTAYAWLVYLVFFLLAVAWTSPLRRDCRGAPRSRWRCYFWCYWLCGARVLWIVAAWFALV